MKLKKKYAVTLAAVMVLSGFGGCGESSNNQSGNSPQSESSGSPVADKGSTSGDSSQNERFDVSIMLKDFNGSPVTGEHADEVKKKINDYTNCNVDLQFVPSESYDDKLGITLVQGDDMPKIMFVNITASVISAAKSGAFWDLTEFMKDKEKLPNLSQANLNANNSVMVNGQLMGVYSARPIGRNGWGYRQDWADKLGLAEPKTVEDLYNMMYAFTYNDPDGNGKDDTYGLCMCKWMGPFDVMQTWFGCGNGWVDQDGKLVPIHMTAEYKNALDWFHKMYEDGLVYSDFAVRDTTTWLDGMYNGECGVFADIHDSTRKINEYFINNNIPAVTGKGVASLHLMAGLAKDADSEPRNLATTGIGGCYVITKAVKTEEEVMKCLQFLDKLNDDEMLILCNYGLENIHWKRDDSGYLEKLWKDSEGVPKAFASLSQAIAGIPTNEPTSVKLKKSEQKIAEEEMRKESEKIAVFNPALSYLNNSETYSTNGSNLDTIISQARTKYIVGQIDEKGLQQAWDNWAAQGGSKVIEEVNSQYKK